VLSLEYVPTLAAPTLTDLFGLGFIDDGPTPTTVQLPQGTEDVACSTCPTCPTTCPPCRLELHPKRPIAAIWLAASFAAAVFMGYVVVQTVRGKLV